MLKGLPRVCSRTWETMMFGEVPTRVTSPPSSEADAIGMSSREGAVPVRRARRWATGIRMARAPTFLLAMDSSAVAAASTGTWLLSLVSRERIGRSATSTIPLRAKAALTTRAMAMITTTSSLKPSKARLAGMTPIRTPASRAPSATRS